ncbi:MAG: PulJ/GspJ family protein, partial [Phycisphaerales bacterium]
NSSPAERSDAGEVPSEARQRGRADSGGARRGFSLFEVLVAIGVILALSIALGAFVRDISRSRERLDASMARQRSADAAIEALERALATTVVEDAILGAGIRGGAERLEVVARGVPAWRLGDPRGRRRSLEDRERLALLGGNAALGESTVRRGEGAEAREGVVPATLRFRYHDGEAWRAEFDSLRTGRLPVAVEVSLWWRRDGESVDDDAEAFSALTDDRDEIDDEALLDEDDRRGAAASLDVPREDLGGPPRAPDRVRVIAVPDAATNLAESESDGDREGGA